MNGRNSYGGYVGFAPFSWTTNGQKLAMVPAAGSDLDKQFYVQLLRVSGCL